MSVKEREEPLSNIPSFGPSLLMPRYWLTWASFPLLYCLSWMPAKLLDRLAGKLGDAVFRKNKKRFHLAKTNLSLCFPDKSEADIVEMVQSHFKAQARAYLQYPLLWWHPRSLLEKGIDVIGLEQIDAVKAEGGNAIILLCHSASLDVAIAAISMRIKASGPYKHVRNQLMDWLIANRRVRFGGVIFTREDGLRPLIKSIRHGRVLIYLADEDLGGISKCAFAPFFGVQKATVPVVGRLAKTTRSRVFTCISYYDYDRSRYVVRILPCIEAITGDDDQADAEAVNAAFEQAVNYCPEQYLWTLRLFQTRPDNEPSVY